ncbi:MAG: YdcF family protein [Acidobacteriota bacterium]|nr:YdcF family protein [Acidobacteriota bacterium]
MPAGRGRAAAIRMGLPVLFCLFTVAAADTWLQYPGALLVSVQPPVRSDVIVAIGGDWFGNRILKAAELAKAGYAPVVLVSGAGYLYGHYEGEIAVNFAVDHGYEARLFRTLEYPCTSTAEEAAAVVAELRRMKVKRYILVTSPSHTARAGRLFRAAAPDLEVRVVAAKDTLDWEHWWKSREGRKAFLLEFTKTATGALGL